MLDPIVKSIDVPCGPQQAFDVFWKDMSAWWPLDKFTTSAMAGQPAKAIRVDARPGGEIVEIGGDDTETLWGVIEAFEPPSATKKRPNRRCANRKRWRPWARWRRGSRTS